MYERRHEKHVYFENTTLICKVLACTALLLLLFWTNNSNVQAASTEVWNYGADGKLRYYKDGTMVTNQFAFDGTYTYYLQADGTPMNSRMTYHPDGKHVIYFDDFGHEVFNSFKYCKDVGYICYFGGDGYAYFNQITFYNNHAYYINDNGKMEQSGWFRFANKLDYGYANPDGTLHTEGFSYDPWGRVVFYHWNGMVARGLITDGVWYYLMDITDGHYLGQFPVGGASSSTASAHKHSYTATVIVPERCYTQGIMRYTCSCGDSYEEAIPTTSHKYEIVAQKETTCTEDGYIIYHCPKCDETLDLEYKACHDYKLSASKKATCMEDGYATYTCSKCGNTYTDTFQALGQHTWDTWTITKAASTSPATSVNDFGIRESYCAACGQKVEENIITIEMSDGSTKQIYGIFDDTNAYELFTTANNFRQANGLTPFTWSNEWESVAKIRTAELAIKYNTTRPNGEYQTYNGIINGLSLTEEVVNGNFSAQQLIDHMDIDPQYNKLRNNYTKYYAASFMQDDNGIYDYYKIHLLK